MSSDSKPTIAIHTSGPSLAADTAATLRTDDYQPECSWCGRMVTVVKRHPVMTGGCVTVVVGFVVLILMVDVASKVIIGVSVLGIGYLVFHHKPNGQPFDAQSFITRARNTATELVTAKPVKPLPAAEWLTQKGFEKNEETYVKYIELHKKPDNIDELYEQEWRDLSVPSNVVAVKADKTAKTKNNEGKAPEHGYLVIKVKINT